MGLRVRLATWYAPILIVAALLARSATRPAGRAAARREAPGNGGRPPSWRAPLASCREMLAPGRTLRARCAAGSISPGPSSRSKLVRGTATTRCEAVLPRRLVPSHDPDRGACSIGLRAFEERLVLPDGRIRCRRSVHVVAIAREPLWTPAPAARARSRDGRAAADREGTCSPASSVAAAEDAAARAGLAGPRGDPARGRRFRAPRMSRLGTMTVTFLLSAPPTQSSPTAWMRATAASHAVVVASGVVGGHRRRDLAPLDGPRRRRRAARRGARLEIARGVDARRANGSRTGSSPGAPTSPSRTSRATQQEEIAVATESLPPAAPCPCRSWTSR